MSLTYTLVTATANMKSIEKSILASELDVDRPEQQTTGPFHRCSFGGVVQDGKLSVETYRTIETTLPRKEP